MTVNGTYIDAKRYTPIWAEHMLKLQQNGIRLEADRLYVTIGDPDEDDIGPALIVVNRPKPKEVIEEGELKSW